jgi:hypothetical protein
VSPPATSRADFSRAAWLTAAEFETCWAALRLGEHPLALSDRLVPLGDTLTDLDRTRRDALAALAERGLADTGGPVTPLAGALRLLATAPTLCDLRTAGDPDLDDLVAVGAMDREHGVVVLAEGDRLAVLPVPGPAVPLTLVELAGALTPARARPVNIPAELFDRAVRDAPDGDLWALADHLTAAGVPRQETNSLARMCTGITAVGQLGVTARRPHPDRGLTEHRGRWVIGYHRGRDGACVQLRRAGTLTVAPIDAQKLLARLAELADDTAAAASTLSGSLRC